MFKVRLIKHVHSCFAGASSNDVYLEREIMLPFPPYSGLSIDDNGFSANVGSEIYWYTKECEFKVYVEPNKELYNLGIKGGFRATETPEAKWRLNEIVQEYVDYGWKRREE